ncbi:hypothetical protein R3P38DRAFT_3288440 [Favolaschia claudopus]|uniref:Uncharacterized protein n=1 Tax=Favolaschia claudopus TaxID=2862362 RepID=A0AAV9ZXD0_9AGAR
MSVIASLSKPPTQSPVHPSLLTSPARPSHLIHEFIQDITRLVYHDLHRLDSTLASVVSPLVTPPPSHPPPPPIARPQIHSRYYTACLRRESIVEIILFSKLYQHILAARVPGTRCVCCLRLRWTRRIGGRCLLARHLYWHPSTLRSSPISHISPNPTPQTRAISTTTVQSPAPHAHFVDARLPSSIPRVLRRVTLSSMQTARSSTRAMTLISALPSCESGSPACLMVCLLPMSGFGLGAKGERYFLSKFRASICGIAEYENNVKDPLLSLVCEGESSALRRRPASLVESYADRKGYGFVDGVALDGSIRTSAAGASLGDRRWYPCTIPTVLERHTIIMFLRRLSCIPWTFLHTSS